ncbi:uncharacterized protein PG998_011461 [Apiospora kogelbergensis]|uniref:uncharacterized protein n=1 Tax=Apiospora kogelbergensis TaxID=1337665 RepID=UPI0031320052
MGLLYAGLVLIPLLWVAGHLRTLARNYDAARSMGLPIVICPYNPDSVVFAIISEPLRPILRCLLPASSFRTFQLTLWGWEFHDKSAAHERLGPALVLVTTGLNRLISADPVMAAAILARRRDFVHPDVTTNTMGLLGPNIVTTSDESWSRQRRIVASALSERISPGVWKESTEQASSLIDALHCSHSSGGSAETVTGLRAVAINVLTRVAYGRHTPFALPSSSRAPSTGMSYVEAISLCTELLLAAAFIPSSILGLPIMPLNLRRLGAALDQLPHLTRDMLDQERRRSFRSDGADPMMTVASEDPPNVIMRTLVRLSDEAKAKATNQSSTSLREKGLEVDSASFGRLYLTEDEIAGNLFIFTAAGFDTTSNTLGYAITLLAAYPEWQNWIQAEIDAVLRSPQGGQSKDASLPDYSTTFPKLVRCLAVMFETLRLFPAVTMVMRSIATTQTIPSAQSPATPLIVPAPCAVYINIMALHTSTSAWGSDALEFKPSRWLRPGYLPWSAGPRKCPGQKMSQVEFVSVIATLFGKCTAEPAPGEGETMLQAKQRLLGLVQDSQPIFTLQMNRPKEIRLQWAKRQVGNVL